MIRLVARPSRKLSERIDSTIVLFKLARSCYNVNMNEMETSEQPRRRSDGEQTHAAILDKAVRLVSIEGVNQITLGRLAHATGVSKSGVYAHFRSKERLQMEIIEAAAEIYEREVIHPGLQASEGLSRLLNLYDAFLSYVEREVFPGGCFFAGLISEFDAQTGPVHEAVVAGHREWEALVVSLVQEAQAQGEIDSDVDPTFLAFQLDAVKDHANFLYTLYRDPEIIERGRNSIHQIIEHCRTAQD
jgi:AcrR family transcriptional regulator